MKLGFMTFVLPEYTIEQLVEFAKRAGFDGVEIRVDSGHAHNVSSESSKEERKRVKDLFAEGGLAIPCVATSVSLSSPDADRHGDFMTMARANLDLAADLGAPVMRVFCGKEAPELDEATAARVAAAFDELGEYAKGTCVTPLLECGHDLVKGAVEIEMIASKVTTDNFCCLWNYSSIDDRTFDVIKGHLRHLHVHKPVLDPANDNILHMAKRLKTIDYQGFICLEIIEKKNLDEGMLIETCKRLKGFMAEA